MKTKIFFIFFSCLLLLNCKDTKPYEPEFTYVSKVSGKKPYYYEPNIGDVYIYNDEYLIETSQDHQSKSVQKIVDSFFQKNCKICTIDTKINYYSFWIIEKTKCTEEYLTTGIKDGCWENGDKEAGVRDYYTALYRSYKRSDKDKSIWVSNLSEKKLGEKRYKDTIYCSHKKIR